MQKGDVPHQSVVVIPLQQVDGEAIRSSGMPYAVVWPRFTSGAIRFAY